MLESEFQSQLIDEIERLFPGCVVLKNDTTFIQGFPDLTILYGKRWAVLECKKNERAPFQPNQEYYLEKLGGMSFASVIWPDIKEEVLDELQQALQPRRATRIPKR